MGKIIAIGGGEIRRSETKAIDKEIIQLAGKKKPKLLFVPTASNDNQDYVTTIKNYFSKLGCAVTALLLKKNPPTKNEIKKNILAADIIYVGGGNSFSMIRTWRKHNVTTYLKQAYKKGIVLSGISAGALCWFRQGSSDSRKFNNPKAPLIKVTGLGLFDALYCPHYDTEKDRRPMLKKMMRTTPGVAIAVEDCCAVEIVDDTYRIISSKKTALAYRVYWKRGKFYEERLVKTKKFLPLAHLLEK